MKFIRLSFLIALLVFMGCNQAVKRINSKTEKVTVDSLGIITEESGNYIIGQDVSYKHEDNEIILRFRFTKPAEGKENIIIYVYYDKLDVTGKVRSLDFYFDRNVPLCIESEYFLTSEDGNMGDNAGKDSGKLFQGVAVVINETLERELHNKDLTSISVEFEPYEMLNIPISEINAEKIKKFMNSSLQSYLN